MNLSASEVFALLGLVITFFGLMASLIWNLWRKVMELNNRINLVQQTGKEELYAFQTAVAEKYVNQTRIIDMERKVLLSEERINVALENLTNRIDRLLERVERTKE